MAVTVQTVIVIPVALVGQDEAVPLFVSPCALVVEAFGLVGEFLSIAYGPDLAVKPIHVDDSGLLLFVDSEVALYADHMEPLAQRLPDVEAEIAPVVLVALIGLTFLEMCRWSVVQRAAGLNKVVIVVLIGVASLIVVFYMMKLDAYCDLPHCACHEDCVLGDLMKAVESIGLGVLCMLDLPRVRSLIVWFEHAMLHLNA